MNSLNVKNKVYISILFFLIFLSIFSYNFERIIILFSGRDLLTIEELKKEKTFTDINIALKNPYEVYSMRLTLKKSTFSFEKLENFIFLQKLDLSGSELDELPSDIWNLKYLQELYLSANHLTALPAEIKKLKFLKKLVLGPYNSENGMLYLLGNNLTSLPSAIGGLKKLTMLYLNHNSLVNLPPEIGKLKKLRILDLSSNQLTQLPPEIGKLVNLEKLYLGIDNVSFFYYTIGNLLKTLPSEIENLSNLKVLDLSGNPINGKERKKIKKLLPHCEIIF